MTPDAAGAFRARLRADLTAAMKARRPEAVSALRSALAAIDNAEAVEGVGGPVVETSAHVAGAREGVGSTEARRGALSEDDLRAILRAEVEERLAGAVEHEAVGQEEAAQRLRDEAAVLTAHLAP